MSGEDAVYELTIDQPNLPKGEPVQIPGLGTFENGYSYTISRDEAEAFRTYHTRQKVKYGDDGSIVGSELEKGPTLLEAAKNMYGLEVNAFDKSLTDDPNKANAKRAVTTSSVDTSWPNASSPYAETETPEQQATSADKPVKNEPKGTTGPTETASGKNKEGGDGK